MPGQGGNSGAGGANRSKEENTKALDKKALRKIEAETNKQPSARAARVKAKKDLAKEKAKARKQDPSVLAHKEWTSRKAANKSNDNVEAKTAKERDLGWFDRDGHLSISGRL